MKSFIARTLYNQRVESVLVHDDEDLQINDSIIIQTHKGLELAKVKSIPESTEEESEYFYVRKAQKEDFDAFGEVSLLNKKVRPQIVRIIAQHRLAMNIVSTEYSLDQSKLCITYVSDDRVDFRELLKDLSSTFKTRIELRQVGARDKAKVVGGIGTCGQETCCSRYKTKFDVISINMAKNQGLSLNTQKLSGQCGKLMCCLKCEDEQYKEYKELFPKQNSIITYKGQPYKVVGLNVIQKVIKLDNRNEVLFVTLDDINTHGGIPS
jgi:cell fate regulator YaaT (PSP1 superfamily)